MVAVGALVPHCETPPLTPEATTALVEEPAGFLGRGGILNKYRKRTCVFGVQAPVRHHVVEQLVQSSLSGPVHCRHVMSHRWQFPCGLKYSPAGGEKTRAPPESSMTISNEMPRPAGQNSMTCFYCQFLFKLAC